MNHTPGCAWDGGRATERRVSRRIAVGSSALALLGILIRSTHSQEQGNESNREGLSKQMQERMEQSRAFSERMRNAASPEERMKIIEERRLQDRRRAIEDLREQLGVPEGEWAVVKPRLEAVYSLRHSGARAGPGNESKRTEVEQKSSELRGLLRNEGAATDQIKAGLTALRAAKERARQELATAQQNLRQILTLRQEALLVLNGLLD
jgi:flagellar motility protein MotE (MotC chaperone)